MPSDSTPTSLQQTSFLAQAGAAEIVGAHLADVGRYREQARRRRQLTALVLTLIAAFLAWRASSVDWNGVVEDPIFVPILFFALMIGGGVLYYSWSGRSPHVMFRPEQIDISMNDVVGLAPVKEEVIRSLNLFLTHATYTREMGGTPRRGLLFEGGPGTGKTHTAKAMAKEAGVPFLFASATSFQSSFYGATARKIRAYFAATRKVARREGGAIAFIDEFDAIGGSRRGMEMRENAIANGMTIARFGTSDLAGPVVNELLVQMQSFDTPTASEKVRGKAVDLINLLLPSQRALKAPTPRKSNILVVAATNRADGLDPALLRPGRFDLRLAFDLPDKAGRRELLDHFLTKKSHDASLDDPEARDAIAAVTIGYSPVMIEHLLDEGLVNAVRRGAPAMSRRDVTGARLTTEVGLGQPVNYTDHERKLIATHESGHALLAYLVAPQRRLEILTIVKRKSALGLLAHGDSEDVYTRSRAELLALIKIALAGQVAEELFFGDVSTGPSGDLAYATTVASQMIGVAGMGDSLVSFEAVASGPFDGTNLVGRVLSDGASRDKVESLLHAAKADVTAAMEANRHVIMSLRNALLERHELIGHEITDVIRSSGPVEIAELPAAPIVTPEALVIDLNQAERLLAAPSTD